MARKMRDSGVEWIGEVPEGWGITRLRFIADITTGNKDTQDANPDGAYPFYVRSPIVERSTDYTFDGLGIMMAGDGAGAGRVFHLATGKYAVHQRVYRISDFKDIDARFLWRYLMITFPFVMDKGSAQSTVPSVRLPMLQNHSIVSPPLPEQQRIADYLDGKCAAIDGAVGELKRGIEDCKAWKKAIIFEAVTGKANVLAASACAIRRRNCYGGQVATADKKNAKVAKRQMRDSGIPWIGEIPGGWELKPLRRLGRLANGISKSGEYFGKGFPFVSYSDVYKNEAIPAQVKGLVEANDQERERYSVKRGDVFFTRTSETVDEIGIAAACLKDIQDSTFAGFLIRFRPITDELLPEFSKYYFRNKLVSEYFAKELVMVTRASLGQELLKSLPVFIPPQKEQQVIADYLDEECAAIDALVAEKEKLIADLEAYKKSLIFELVTGKREVA